MARADLLCELIKNGLSNDNKNFRIAAEAICAEERSKSHTVLAAKIEELLKTTNSGSNVKNEINKSFALGSTGSQLIHEVLPRRRLDQLILPDNVIALCRELIEEQMRSDILKSHGLEPRNKILLVGPPGNGKTSLAESMAEALMVPLYTVKYENIVGAYLGETANKLAKLFEFAKTRECVLFFDEFETIGKERGDYHETGEIKRVVSSLLLSIDALPSYVVVIAATNHETLLDKAAWRRFQMKIELPRPDQKQLELWLNQFEKRTSFRFGHNLTTLSKKFVGKSYSEIEEFALSVYRQFVLKSPGASEKDICTNQLKLYSTQVVNHTENEKKE